MAKYPKDGLFVKGRVLEGHCVIDQDSNKPQVGRVGV